MSIREIINEAIPIVTKLRESKPCHESYLEALTFHDYPNPLIRAAALENCIRYDIAALKEPLNLEKVSLTPRAYRERRIKDRMKVLEHFCEWPDVKEIKSTEDWDAYLKFFEIFGVDSEEKFQKWWTD